MLVKTRLGAVAWAGCVLIMGLITFPAAGASIVTADDVTAGISESGVVEVYLERTGDDQGTPMEDVLNFQVGVELIGPDAGTLVVLTGGVDTIGRPQAGAEHLEDATVSATEIYRPTFNIGDPFDIPDGAGLLRVEFEVHPGATLGEYTLHIKEGAGATDTIFSDPMGQPIPFSADSSTIHVVPEPGSAALLGLAALALMRRGRTRRFSQPT